MELMSVVSQVPTDAIVLRGWYANISVAIYGRQTELAIPEMTSNRLRPPEVSPSKTSSALSPKDSQKSPSPMLGGHGDSMKKIVVDEATGVDEKDQVDKKVPPVQFASNSVNCGNC